MSKRFWILMGIAAVFTLAAAPGQANAALEAVGQVVALRGEVKAINGSMGERLLTMKSEVFQTDTVRTGSGGRIQLHFKDNTIVSLGPDTVVEIARYEWDAGKQTGAMQTRVSEGTFRVLGGMLTKKAPKNFTTETPAATIGIRGSMYAGSYLNNQLNVVFIGGRGIFVSNPHGHVEIDQAGYGTRVPMGHAPEPPVKMDVAGFAGMVEGLGEEGTGGDEQSGLSPENAELLDSGTGGVTDTTTVEVAANTAADAVADASGQEAVDEVEEATAADAKMTGQSQVMLRRMSDGVLVDYAQLGVTADSVDGLVSPVLSDGTVLAPVTMTPYNPDGTYASWDWQLVGDPVDAATAVGTIATDRDVAWDDTGEFFIYEQNYPGNIVTVNDVDYLYQSFAFGGVPTPSASLPTTGVDTYWGEFLGDSLEPDIDPNGEMPESMMVVNWANGKAFGTILDNDNDNNLGGDLMYYYGDISDPSSFQFISGEPWTYPYDNPAADDVWTMNGIATFAQFYGSDYQGFGLTANGNDYSIYDMSQMGSWQAVGALYREPGATTASPTGTKTWAGFYVGFFDNLDGGQSYAQTGGGLSLSLDAATGSVTGSLAGVTIGGEGNSAYVDDQHFIAEAIPGTYDLYIVQPEGSFMVTAAPELQFSNYASWGYWNAVYEDSQTGNMVQVHSPGAYWVAGEQTPVGVIDDLIETNYTGTYVGPAYGTSLDWSTKELTPLTGGTTDLAFTFGTGEVVGAITFDQVNLPVSGTAALYGNSSFLAENAVTGATGGSALYGGFYGPNAETMAGSFMATMPDNKTYSGIYGGNR